MFDRRSRTPISFWWIRCIDEITKLTRKHKIFCLIVLLYTIYLHIFTILICLLGSYSLLWVLQVTHQENEQVARWSSSYYILLGFDSFTIIYSATPQQTIVHRLCTTDSIVCCENPEIQWQSCVRLICIHAADVQTNRASPYSDSETTDWCIA